MVIGLQESDEYNLKSGKVSVLVLFSIGVARSDEVIVHCDTVRWD